MPVQIMEMSAGPTRGWYFQDPLGGATGVSTPETVQNEGEDKGCCLLGHPQSNFIRVQSSEGAGLRP